MLLHSLLYPTCLRFDVHHGPRANAATVLLCQDAGSCLPARACARLTLSRLIHNTHRHSDTHTQLSRCSPVGGALGGVDQLVSQALGNGLDVTERSLASARCQEPDSLHTRTCRHTGG